MYRSICEHGNNPAACNACFDALFEAEEREAQEARAVDLVETEAERTRRAKIRTHALSKLSDEEKEILGLK